MSFRNLFNPQTSSLSSIINFDNAATTPPLLSVQDAVSKAFLTYGAISRSIGDNSDSTTISYGYSKKTILQFVGAFNPEYSVIYTKNTTEGINLLAYLILQSNPHTKVLISRMEHHSNDLPWRSISEPLYFEVDALGRLDLKDLTYQLESHSGMIDYVCVSATSNVTGYKTPIHEIAKLAHQHGAKIIVDAAQLVAHGPINMYGDSKDESIDFLVFSGHKMYAPFGSGVVVGKLAENFSNQSFMLGGGTVNYVDDSQYSLNPIPSCFEAGTQNVAGAIAIESAIKTFYDIGMDNVISHENTLKNHLLYELKSMPHVLLYGDTINTSDRTGIITLNLKDMNYMDVALKLYNDFGIATRCGKFCAHSYTHRLFDAQSKPFIPPLYYGEKGMVRISLGLYNTLDETNILLDALHSFK